MKNLLILYNLYYQEDVIEQHLKVLIENQKEDRRFFEDLEDGFKYYIDIFKSPKYLAIKQNLIDFCFSSKYIYSIHPESLTNIISAEIEFDENKSDVTYDFRK